MRNVKTIGCNCQKIWVYGLAVTALLANVKCLYADVPFPFPEDNRPWALFGSIVMEDGAKEGWLVFDRGGRGGQRLKLIQIEVVVAALFLPEIGPGHGGLLEGGQEQTAKQRRVILAERVVVVPDYSDFVGGGKYLPNPVPNSLEEEHQALLVFEELEKRRLMQYVPTDRAVELVIIDRSVQTLLAHCYAIGLMNNLPLLPFACDLLRQSTAPRWPDLILYLDTPQEAIRQRNKGKFPEDSIFINPEFNSQFRSYFQPQPKFNASPTAHLSAVRDPFSLCHEALQVIGRQFSLTIS